MSTQGSKNAKLVLMALDRLQAGNERHNIVNPYSKYILYIYYKE